VKLIDELRAEHDLIERVAASLQAFAKLRRIGEADPRDGERFLRFFRSFSGSYHHGREERTLFRALVDHAELRPSGGPIGALTEQHRSLALTLEQMAPRLTSDRPYDRETLLELTQRYTRALWQHIDAENSVLLPESEERLRRAGVAELTGPPPSEEETAAREEGWRLVAAYPPVDDPEAIRGEGCVICPSYGTACQGIEREWWSEYEWEAHGERDG
jgi:hemerythrin-like domain-containing protein